MTHDYEFPTKFNPHPRTDCELLLQDCKRDGQQLRGIELYSILISPDSIFFFIFDFFLPKYARENPSAFLVFYLRKYPS